MISVKRIYLGATCGDNAGMETIDDVRRIKLQTLIAEAGSAAKLSAKTGVQASYISQMKTGHRNCGDIIARQLERGMGKRKGWMDALEEQGAISGAFTIPLVGNTETGAPADFIKRNFPRDWPTLVASGSIGGRAYALSMSDAHAALHVPIATTNSALIADPDAELAKSAIVSLHGTPSVIWFRIDSAKDGVIRGANLLQPLISMEIPPSVIHYAHAVIGFISTV